MMTTYGLLFTLLWSLGEPLARAAAVEQSFDENCASASRGATVEAFDGRMVEGATSVEDQAPSTFPSQKMAAIFPGPSVPPDLKESWQQHLMEHFTSLRGSDDADVPSAADCASPSTMDRHVSDSSPSSNDDRRRDARFQGDFGAGEEDALDDRTILDVFGEAAKEFLTQRVIPDTDAECRWDWRSVRCEPACECSVEAQWGDFHLGRSCRLREEVDDTCEAVNPASIWQDTPATRRILSLATQTAGILRVKLSTGWRKAMGRAANRFSSMQHNMCDDLWTLYQEQRASQLCLPQWQIPVRSLPQQVLCGPVDFEACDDSEYLQESMSRAVFRER